MPKILPAGERRSSLLGRFIRKKKPELAQLGWREWAELPELGVRRIKVKVDTGARSSAIHAFAIERPDARRVRFGIRPLQKSAQEIWCEAEVLEERWVTDSGGNRELRPFIRTPISLGGQRWDIEVSLTERSGMRFRMLLGRTALGGRFTVNPASSFLMGKRK